MKYIDADLLRKEIERLKEEVGIGLSEYDQGYENGRGEAYNKILAILNTLPEQPVVKKSNALFDECVKNCDPAVMKEVSDNVDKMLGRQPVSDHHEIEVEFRGEKVTINREFYRDGEKNYSTSEQDDNAIWSALRAWCEKKGITPFELYPKQPEQPVEGLEEADLKKEIIRFQREDMDRDTTVGDVARHFYELGQQSRPKISDNSFELEQEILSYIRGMGFGYGGWVDGLEDEDLCKLARHFAEWGAEHLKR